MNVAFPAIFIFCLLLPGFLFRQFYQRREVRSFEHSPFSTVALEAVLWAGLFNFIACLLAYALGYPVEIGDVVRLLIGGPASLSVLTPSLNWLNQHPLISTAYFALSSGLALLAAFAWRGLVSWRQWDRRDHWLCRFARGAAPWHYLFSGLDYAKPEEVDGAVISAIVEFKDAAYLYTGILCGYEVSDQGELDRLLLAQTQRRKLADDRSLDGSNADAVRFYPIAGDIFVLRYSEIKTLNVSYLSLPES